MNIKYKALQELFMMLENTYNSVLKYAVCDTKKANINTIYINNIGFSSLYIAFIRYEQGIVYLIDSEYNYIASIDTSYINSVTVYDDEFNAIIEF